MGVIIYNGISSATIPCLVESFPDHVYPERNVETTHIPGRNGDYLVDYGEYQNVDRAYNIAVCSRWERKELPVMIRNAVNWLHSVQGYARLEDSYEPEYFRLATYKEGTTFTNVYNEAAKATITFNCKPQVFLKKGEIPILNPKTLYNPTSFTALPKIRVYGSGMAVITVGKSKVTVSSINTQTTIDSERQEALLSDESYNPLITVEGGFPKLEPGATSIAWSGSNITKVEVIPRWWTL